MLFLASAGTTFNVKPRGVKPPHLPWLGAIGMGADSNMESVEKGALVLLLALEIGTYWNTVVSRDRGPVGETKCRCRCSNAREAEGLGSLFFCSSASKKWMFSISGDELDVFVLKLCFPGCHPVM